MNSTNIAIRSLLPIILNLSKLILDFCSDTLTLLTLSFSSVIDTYIPVDAPIFEVTHDVLLWLVDALNIGDVSVITFVFGFVAIMFVVDLAKKFL